MSKPQKAELAAVLTANRLTDGAVVYRTAAGAWAERIDEAAVYGEKADTEAALKAGLEDVIARRVAGPYLFDVPKGEHPPRPLSVRERIRAAGPTVRLDLGKQAEPRAA